MATTLKKMKGVNEKGRREGERIKSYELHT